MVLDEEAQSRAEVWNYIFGYIKTSVVKCAVELELPDVVEKHGAPISLSQLSSAVDCPTNMLYRIMRFLICNNIFKKTMPSHAQPYHHHHHHDDDVASSIYYAQTPLSRLMTSDNLGPFLLLQGTPRGPTVSITAEALKAGRSRPGLKPLSSDDDLYDHPAYSMEAFRDAMASHARLTTSAMIDNYAECFEGIGSLVDVGGSYGMTLGMLVKAFPWVRGICFDLPEVVAKAPPLDGIKFVGGSMFEGVPRADAVVLMFVLHNWSDEECINILKKCKEAIPANTGKVMIVDAIIDEDGEGDEYTGARLSLDMLMMGVTFKGKERTYKEWDYILKESGFRRYVVKNIKAVESVIEAYP